MPQGTVTEYLVQLLAKQVDDRGVVVWYDPEHAYDAAAAELTLPNTTVARYSGSFLQLRREIDPFLNDVQPPRLVVYVPLEREQTHSALIELDCAGVVMQPRQQPPACNTRLSVVARNALRPILAEDQVLEIERQVEAGQLSLADLNALADQGIDISTGVVKLIFGTANPQDVALAFLHGDSHDAEVGKKAAQKELRHLLQVAFDIELAPTEALANWRMKLGRHVLLTDLFAALKEQAPSSLSSVSVAHGTGGIDACVRLTRTWRNSREHRDRYVTVADQVEQDLGLDRLELPVEPLKDNDTLHCVERALLAWVENELLEAATPELLQLAEHRLSRFWAEVIPALQARWALISSAAAVLLEADRVGKALKKAPTTVPALVKAYADDDEPWCLLDTHHRHLESRKYNFEFAASNDHQGLEKLIIKAEQRYTAVGSALAKHFITHFQKAKHPLQGLPRQRDIFEKQVKPLLGEGKVAYLWVDALRFEMARELCRLLADDFKVEIQPAIAAIPTITEIGMAALLPQAHESAKVVSVGGGKLALEIGGKIIKDRKDRVAFLKEHAGAPVFDAKLDDLLPKPGKKVKDGIQNARLILMTSQEIDELGEAGNLAQARLQMDGVLSQLRRGVRILADHGINTLVLAADHGHWFADEIGEDMKIENPGGQVADLHRRVWVGVGGASEPSYLRASLTSLGMESEFDLATPWTFAVFKAKGGGRAFFHGGLSPQELIVPVVVLHSTTASGGRKHPVSGAIQWTLTPGAAKLTTRFFSVRIAANQSQSSLFGFEPPKVRIELRANKKGVSLPVSASYGFEDATGEVTLKLSAADPKRIEPNTVTLMLTEEIAQKTVGVYLLDATTGVELAAPLTVEVAIAL
ncbi:MAG: PglZ domain-containing protein [Candidatus Competibacteraceae bacterium]